MNQQKENHRLERTSAEATGGYMLDSLRRKARMPRDFSIYFACNEIYTFKHLTIYNSAKRFESPLLSLGHYSYLILLEPSVHR